MSRYVNIDTISFTDKNEQSFPVKDIRPISDEPIAFTLPVSGAKLLDEIASRQDVYGNFGEGQSHRIFDANIVKLMESKFDLTKLKELNIPL